MKASPKGVARELKTSTHAFIDSEGNEMLLRLKVVSNERFTIDFLWKGGANREASFIPRYIAVDLLLQLPQCKTRVGIPFDARTISLHLPHPTSSFDVLLEEEILFYWSVHHQALLGYDDSG